MNWMSRLRPSSRDRKGSRPVGGALPDAVPPFATYYPSREILNREQREFFTLLSNELEAARYPAVNGNISYLFLYAYELLAEVSPQNAASVRDRLLDLHESYAVETAFSEACFRWALDCLLVAGDVSAYLELSERSEITGVKPVAEMRVNAARSLGVSPRASDIMALVSPPITRFSTEHLPAWLDHVQELLDALEGEVGDLGEWLRSSTGLARDGIPMYLFNAAPLNHVSVPFPYVSYTRLREPALSRLRDIARQAENHLRSEMSVPLVGEGWVSETAIFRALEAAFPQTAVIHHGRPAWLGKQHLDIWFPRWRIAVEVQGKQHYEPVEFFGGVAAFEATVARDERKRLICQQRSVTLLEVPSGTPPSEVVRQIQDLRNPRKSSQSARTS